MTRHYYQIVTPVLTLLVGIMGGAIAMNVWMSKQLQNAIEQMQMNALDNQMDDWGFGNE